MNVSTVSTSELLHNQGLRRNCFEMLPQEDMQKSNIHMSYHTIPAKQMVDAFVQSAYKKMRYIGTKATLSSFARMIAKGKTKGLIISSGPPNRMTQDNHYENLHLHITLSACSLLEMPNPRGIRGFARCPQRLHSKNQVLEHSLVLPF